MKYRDFYRHLLKEENDHLPKGEGWLRKDGKFFPVEGLEHAHSVRINPKKFGIDLSSITDTLLGMSMEEVYHLMFNNGWLRVHIQKVGINGTIKKIIYVRGYKISREQKISLEDAHFELNAKVAWDKERQGIVVLFGKDDLQEKFDPLDLGYFKDKFFPSPRKYKIGWLRKDGEYFSSSEDEEEHLKPIINNPSKFGITLSPKEIEDVKTVGFSNIYKKMFSNGWLRVLGSGDEIYVEGHQITSSQKRTLENFHFEANQSIIWDRGTRKVELFEKYNLKEIVTAPHGTDERELAMGMTLEMENTDSQEIAHALVLRNLKVNPHHYTDLKKRGHRVLNDISPSSGFGDPDNAINRKQRHGTVLTPTCGNNIVGSMDGTPPVEGTDGKRNLRENINDKIQQVLNTMKNYDPMHGSCGVFTYRLKKLAGGDIYGFWHDTKKTMPEDLESFPEHCFLKIGNDLYDAEGRINITKLKNQYPRHVLKPIPMDQVDTIGDKISEQGKRKFEESYDEESEEDNSKWEPVTPGLQYVGHPPIKKGIEKAEMILASPSLEAALRKLVGTPLDKLQDKISFMNLYIGNKYGIGGVTPEKESSVQRFLNAVVLWVFQKKVWPTNKMFDRQIEDAKKEKFSHEFKDYMDKEQAVRIKLANVFKKALANKTRSTDDPDYKSASQERSSLYDTHPWKTFENSLRKEKDQLIKTNSAKPITIEDVTPSDDDILEAKNTYQHLKKGWDEIHRSLHEMAQISKTGKTVMAGSEPLKGLSVEAVEGNVVFFRMDKGGFVAPGFTLVYFMDSDESAKDIKEGRIPYLMVPRGTFFSGGSPITDIWKKKFQKPGTEHILGVIEGNSNEENIFIDMITVRPGYQRNSIASKMLSIVKKEYPTAKVSTSAKTNQGEKFFGSVKESKIDVFHNTDSKFSKLDRSMVGKGKYGVGTFGKGFYFSDKPNPNYGKYFMKGTLELKNPIIADFDYKNPSKFGETWKKITNAFDNGGEHDGAIITDVDNGKKEYIAFNPEQFSVEELSEGGSKLLGQGRTSDQGKNRGYIYAYDPSNKVGNLHATPDLTTGKKRRTDNIRREGLKKVINEMGYKGNVGIVEVMMFMKIATQEQKDEFLRLLDEEKIVEAWKFIQSVTQTHLVP